MKDIRETWAEIDLSALSYNITKIKTRLNPSTKFCAVVKGCGYGHGAVQVAQEALRCGVDFFAVAFLQEAIELREAGIAHPILVLGAPFLKNAEDIVRYHISQTVFDETHLNALNEAGAKQQTKAKVHIKIDSGMHRIGIPPEDAAQFARKAAQLPWIDIEGIFSHFATADEQDKTFTVHQFERFQQAVQSIRAEGIDIPLRHIANSAAVMELPEYQLDMVRPGIILYGIAPGEFSSVYQDLKPVMCIKSTISYVKSIAAGETVGYGRHFTASRPSVIATVPIGFTDGLFRRIAHKGYMIVHGHKAPIAGNICADQLMLDVTDIPNVHIGDEVIVFGGPQLPVYKVASWAETTCYEVLCAIMARVPRRYIH